MILGFTGTQEGTTKAQRVALIWWFTENDITEFHHGDCVGADAQAWQIVDDMLGNTVRKICHPPAEDARRAFTGPNDETREPRPYLDRNQDIVDEVDLLLACPKEQERDALRSGTWATIRRARNRGIPVVIVRPDGTIEE